MKNEQNQVKCLFETRPVSLLLGVDCAAVRSPLSVAVALQLICCAADPSLIYLYRLWALTGPRSPLEPTIVSTGLPFAIGLGCALFQVTTSPVHQRPLFAPASYPAPYNLEATRPPASTSYSAVHRILVCSLVLYCETHLKLR